MSYKEYFEHLPAFMTNEAVGKYSVSANKSAHLIVSEHMTCMLPKLNMWCLTTHAVDAFYDYKVSTKKGCQLQEVIEFECPLLLVPLCHAEVKSQRTKVLENLSSWSFYY